jgi:hypothetical protein
MDAGIALRSIPVCGAIYIVAGCAIYLAISGFLYSEIGI